MVTLVDPANGATDVAINKIVAVTFTEAMDPATVTALTFTVKKTISGDSVSGIVTPFGLSATFAPDADLAYSTQYTATITTGAKDLAGNALASTYSWNFTTPDTAPTVSSILPTFGPTAGNTPVTITGTGFVSGATVSIGGNAATGVTFGSATSITATTPTGMAGHKNVVVTNPDAQSGTLTGGFTYVAVPLGSASTFAVLAGAGITVAGTVNSTTITGNMGTYSTTTITGIENVVLTGTNHAGDAVTQQAKTDLATAYDDAAGRSATTTYGAIYDLGG